MPKAIMVRDRAGNIIRRPDGLLLDGDVVHIPITLMDSAAGTLRLTDAQRAVAQEGIRQALAHHAARGGQVQDTGMPSFGLTDAERDAAQGARDARTAFLGDAWKSPEVREAQMRSAGRSYEDRMTNAWREHR